MNRGSAARDPSAEPCDAGFNEAPIHESGKFQHGLIECNPFDRFNEAPIHESGKLAKPTKA